MYNQEKIKPYNSTDEKGKVVEEMFDNIASTYDTLNHRLSWNIDKSWRKKAIEGSLHFLLKQYLILQLGLVILQLCQQRCFYQKHLSVLIFLTK